MRRHPYYEDALLVTTRTRLYEIIDQGCNALFGADETEQHCSDNNVVLTQHAIQFINIGRASGNFENKLSSDLPFADFVLPILVTDRLSHCVHVFDLQSGRHEVFTGMCGVSGRDDDVTLSEVRLHLPSSLWYRNYISDSDDVLIYMPHETDDGRVHMVKCELTEYGHCELFYYLIPKTNGDGVVNYYFNFYEQPNPIILVNDNCHMVVGGQPGKLCILSGAFGLSDFYFINSTSGSLQATNFVLTNGSSDTKMVCTYYQDDCIDQGFTLLTEAYADDSFFAFTSLQNKIHAISVIEAAEDDISTTTNPTPDTSIESMNNIFHAPHHTTLRLTNNVRCSALLGSFITLSVDICTYRCYQLNCECLTYDNAQATNAENCQLFDTVTMSGGNHHGHIDFYVKT